MTTDSPSSSPLDRNLVRVRVVRMRAIAQGVAIGIVCAACVFLATIWLVIKGGKQVGPHLSLLGQYFIGYRVTFWGAWIGAAYAFAVGFVGGTLVAYLYNMLARLRDKRAS